MHYKTNIQLCLTNANNNIFSSKFRLKILVTKIILLYHTFCGSFSNICLSWHKLWAFFPLKCKKSKRIFTGLCRLKKKKSSGNHWKKCYKYCYLFCLCCWCVMPLFLLQEMKPTRTSSRISPTWPPTTRTSWTATSSTTRKDPDTTGTPSISTPSTLSGKTLYSSANIMEH